jgi:hypothetical protein
MLHQPIPGGAVENRTFSSPPGSSITSGIALHEGQAGQLAEVDARLSRTLDHPTDRHRVTPTKIALRERLRRPLRVGSWISASRLCGAIPQ